MPNATLTKAEQQYLAAQKKTQKALKQKDKERLASTEKTRRLRALRLAKEATDKEAAAAAAEAAATGKPAKKKKPARIPEPYRHS